MEITRAVTAEDFQAFRLLLDEMATWDAAETRACGIDPAVVLAEFYGDDAKALQQIFSQPRTAMFLARVEGAVAGCGGFGDQGDGIAEVAKVYVRPAFRGRGIGRALVARLLDAIGGEGFRLVRLETASFMTEAIASYERFGFHRCHAFRPVLDGLGPISVFMEREMRAGEA